MARVRFLAACADPRPGQEGIVYGPLHETDFQTEDVDFVMTLWGGGKVEILDTTGLPLAQEQFERSLEVA
jgi:hypothetical protein